MSFEFKNNDSPKPEMSKPSGFDPDKRVEKNKEGNDKNPRKEGFDPDKRLAEKDSVEKNEPIQNKKDGDRRQKEEYKELNEKYPSEKGYKILQEVFLTDKNGTIVKDPYTDSARRIDFVVVKGNEVVDSIEVTSKTEDKRKQSLKEYNIRNIGGNYVKNEGVIYKFPNNIDTRIERRD